VIAGWHLWLKVIVVVLLAEKKSRNGLACASACAMALMQSVFHLGHRGFSNHRANSEMSQQSNGKRQSALLQQRACGRVLLNHDHRSACHKHNNSKCASEVQ